MQVIRDRQAPEAAPAGGELAEPPFDLQHRDTLTTPLIFASPHSGRLYPPDMMAASALGVRAIRRSEDVLVDDLIGDAVELGAALIAARYARAYVDVNRNADELDPAMFEDDLPGAVRTPTPRVAAGLGAIARVVAEGQEIYSRKLSVADAQRRIKHIHQPYHAALADLLAAARAQFGAAFLIDWHSMPSAAARAPKGGRSVDFVLGDRFGSSCTPALTSRVDQELRSLGYEAARNTPYAGGYTTELYGAPALGVHVLQIEINRALYLDEAALEPNAGYALLKANLNRLIESLALNWRKLV